ncbi:hypothetical protein ACFL2R_00930 [Patescibacteria group bacterium]
MWETFVFIADALDLFSGEEDDNAPIISIIGLAILDLIAIVALIFLSGMISGKIVVIAIIVMIMVNIGAAFSFLDAHRRSETMKILRRLADEAKKNNSPSGMSGHNDAWGREIKIIRRESDDNFRVSYIAASSGNDGVFDTDNDLSATSTNREIAKMAGAIAVDGAVGVTKWAAKNGGKLLSGAASRFKDKILEKRQRRKSN